jgi:hypothetical protein
MPHEVYSCQLKFELPTWALPEIASSSVAALKPRCQYLESWTARYRGLAVEKGYLASTGFIGAKRLSNDLKAMFSAAFLHQAKCDYPVERQNVWPVRMINSQADVFFTSVKHILLHTFLSDFSTARA